MTWSTAAAEANKHYQEVTGAKSSATTTHRDEYDHGETLFRREMQYVRRLWFREKAAWMRNRSSNCEGVRADSQLHTVFRDDWHQPRSYLDKGVAPGTFPRKIFGPGLEKSTKTTKKTNKKQEQASKPLFFPSFPLLLLSFSRALRPPYLLRRCTSYKPSQWDDLTTM